jgi:hypothetical protein
MALPPYARVEVRLRRGEARRAHDPPKVAVPIPFELSVLPEPDGDAAGYALEASIFSPQGPLFATAAEVPVEAGTTGVEVLVRRAPASR